MSNIDRFDVIQWANELLDSNDTFKEKLRQVGVQLARRKAGVEGLLTRDLQQRVLNKVTEQRIGLRLNEKTARLQDEACKEVRKNMSRGRYNSEQWIADNQIVSKDALKEYIRKTIRNAHPEHFKELDAYAVKLRKRTRDKAA